MLTCTHETYWACSAAVMQAHGDVARVLEGHDSAMAL